MKFVSAALAVTAACEVAEVTPLRDTRDGGAETGDGELPNIEDSEPPQAQVVVEEALCSPCGVRTRTCVDGVCADWGACESGPCVPAGTLCGLRINELVGACRGEDPAVACPEGYSRVKMQAAGDLLTSCALDVGNCEGSACVPERLPAYAVCGMAHDANSDGVRCGGTAPAQDGCPFGTRWSGRTDFGMPAGFGVQVCVATAGTAARDGLCGWAHTRSSLSGTGIFWCDGAELGVCPDECDEVGPLDVGSGDGQGWMTCACP